MERSAHFAQFEDIETPLPGLELADEGLRSTEAFGYLLLRQASLDSYLPEQSKEFLLIGRRGELVHIPTIESERSYPKRG